MVNKQSGSKQSHPLTEQNNPKEVDSPLPTFTDIRRKWNAHNDENVDSSDEVEQVGNLSRGEIYEKTKQYIENIVSNNKKIFVHEMFDVLAQLELAWIRNLNPIPLIDFLSQLIKDRKNTFVASLDDKSVNHSISETETVIHRYFEAQQRDWKKFSLAQSLTNNILKNFSRYSNLIRKLSQKQIANKTEAEEKFKIFSLNVQFREALRLLREKWSIPENLIEMIEDDPEHPLIQQVMKRTIQSNNYSELDKDLFSNLASVLKDAPNFQQHFGILFTALCFGVDYKHLDQYWDTYWRFILRYFPPPKRVDVLIRANEDQKKAGALLAILLFAKHLEIDFSKYTFKFQRGKDTDPSVLAYRELINNRIGAWLAEWLDEAIRFYWFLCNADPKLPQLEDVSIEELERITTLFRSTPLGINADGQRYETELLLRLTAQTDLKDIKQAWTLVELEQIKLWGDSTRKRRYKETSSIDGTELALRFEESGSYRETVEGYNSVRDESEHLVSLNQKDAVDDPNMRDALRKRIKRNHKRANE